MTPPEPACLGEYSLLEKLGQGGMALVYRAERVGEAGFKKKVAIKRMLPAYRRDPALLERFAAEARTNARLDHPNLVHVLDFGIEPEPYLVLEFVEGVTLAALLQRLVEKGERLEIAAACFIGAEAAQGLDHAHRKRDEQGSALGIVHRDVSPQNCLLSSQGAVKVSDFGLVKAADNVVQTGTGVPIGKMTYMAPEQAGETPIDARADVFSLGIVVWEMLAMRPLMPAHDPARASAMLQACAFEPPSRYNPKVAPALDAIVMGCLEKDPAARTPSAQALSMRLLEVLHEVAPGYGRDQLSRLLGWSFPEKGWIIDEPHETAAQPTTLERLSMPHPPAAVQRASLEPATKSPPNDAPASAARRTALPWIVGLGLLLVAACVGALALGVAFYVMTERDDAPASAGFAIAVQPNPPGARVFHGPRELDPPIITEAALDGDAIVIVAPGYEPLFISADTVRRGLANDLSALELPLTPSADPARAVFIHHPRPAVARSARTHEILGPIPGVVLASAGAEIEIVEGGRAVARVSTSACDPEVVCVLGGP